MMKVSGLYEDLQYQLTLTNIPGEWRDLGNHKQFRASDGSVLNWWASTKTLTFQGKRPENLRAAIAKLASVKELCPPRADDAGLDAAAEEPPIRAISRKE